MRKYYVGLDVHKLTIAIAVLDAYGKFVSRTVIQTSTEAVREFFQHLGGEVHLTFEEGNQSAWLYDVVEPLVKRVVVCNPGTTASRAAATIRRWRNDSGSMPSSRSKPAQGALQQRSHQAKRARVVSREQAAGLDREAAQ